MAGGYLTSSQVARLLGISKRTVLYAVDAGELRAAHRMPGGAYRFMTPDVERYAQRRALAQQRLDQVRDESHATNGRRADAPAARGESRGADVKSQAGAIESHAGGVGGSMTSAIVRLADVVTQCQGGTASEIADILELLADSLIVGMTLVARVQDGVWRVEYVHDRMGMGLHPGDRLPYAGHLARTGNVAGSFVVEDVHSDARFMDVGVAPACRVGAMAAIPLTWADGAAFGALYALHPTARSLPSGAIALMRLAARLTMQTLETAAARERERRQAQRAAQLAAIVEQSDDAIYGLSPQGQIQTWNTSAYRLYGYTAAEALGRDVRMLVPHDRSSNVADLLARVARGEHIAHYDTVRRCKDGRLVDVSVTLSPIRNSSGSVTGASATARDISAQVRAAGEREQAREVAEELARLRQAQVEEAEILAAVGAALGGSLELRDVYGVILEQAARLLPYDLAGVIEYEGEWATVVASAGALAIDAGTRFRRRPGSEQRWNLAPGATTYVPDTEQEPAWRGVEPEAAAIGLRSIVHVPLVSRGDAVVGALSLTSRTPNQYTEHQVRVAKVLADRATQALHNARLYASEQARAEAAEELARVREAAVASARFQATMLSAVGQAVAADELGNSAGYWNCAAEIMCGQAAEALGRDITRIGPGPAAAAGATRIIAGLLRDEVGPNERLA